MYDFLTITNETLTDRDVELPLPGQSTTTPETRFDMGWQAQEALVGDRLTRMRATASPDTKHIIGLAAINEIAPAEG